MTKCTKEKNKDNRDKDYCPDCGVRFVIGGCYCPCCGRSKDGSESEEKQDKEGSK